MRAAALLAGLLSLHVHAQASARLETTPIPSGAGAANDTAIWLHPTNLARSLIFGTDQLGAGGLIAYGLDGGIRQSVSGFGPTYAVDVRYGVDIGGIDRDVVLAVTTDGNFRLYSPDRDAGALSLIDNAATITGNLPASAAMFLNPQAGSALYVFVADAIGVVRQYRVNVVNGKAVPALVRTVNMPGRVDGMAVNDLAQELYLTVANKGLYVLDAEQAGGTTPKLVDSVDAGRLEGAAGLALYLLPDAGGYLIASASAASRFSVYSLRLGNPFVTSFAVVPSGGAKGVSNTRGIDVTPLNLGAPFTKGMFVAHDPNNLTGPNYKLIAWDDIAGVTTPALTVDVRLDPRTWKVLDAGPGDAGAKDAGVDAGSLPICPLPVDAGPSDGGADGGDAGAPVVVDAGPCMMAGTGGGGGNFNPGTGGGGFPPIGGGGGAQEPMGCGCSHGGLLLPLAWALGLLRRRRHRP